MKPKNRIKFIFTLALIIIATLSLTANADDILSSEDWEGATHSLDYANTDYDTSDTIRNAIVSVPASSPSPAEGSDPTGQCGMVRGNTDKYYTLRDPLPLASGGYTSVEVSYAICINTVGQNLQLQYSASGNFDDTQGVKTHIGTENSGTTPATGTPYEINRWYAGQTVTLDPETYTFTNTAKIRWRPISGSGMTLKRYVDDIVITGIGDTPSVDAGVDMITLSGMDIVLDPTVVNNDPNVPQRPLSYEWTTDAPGGYTVQWDPSNTVEAPTVTITPDTPGNPSTVTLTLKVDLVGTPLSASDTMTIDVYDDACLAAQAASSPSEPFDPTDLDKNCTTDLKDFAILSAEWLIDQALTAPIPIP